MQGFDLNALNEDRATTGVKMIVTSPITSEPLTYENGDGHVTDVTITLLGADSEVVRAVKRAAQNRRFRKGLLGATKVTAEELEAEALTILCKQVVAWDGIKLGDEVLDANEANARLVFTKFPWLKAQVDTFVNEVSNFVGN